LQSLKEGKIPAIKQNENLMTYFGKRTSEDGGINWNWQRERIYTWVRALAHSYSGAFCFLRDVRIIINRMVFLDIGFFLILVMVLSFLLLETVLL
jgi:methionyl-tRNA formyltransferase